MKTDKYRVMSFGLGGNTAEGINPDGNRVSSSWYLRADQLQEYFDSGHYKAEEYEGCILIDKRNAVIANPGLAFDSPMVDPRLSPGQDDRFTADALHPAAALVLSEVARHSPTVGLLAARAITDRAYIGLDHVSPEDYAQWWKDHGALIGRIEAGNVIWKVEP